MNVTRHTAVTSEMQKHPRRLRKTIRRGGACERAVLAAFDPPLPPSYACLVPLLFVLFTALPFLEIYLLLRIGQRLGLGGTLALVLVTGLMGAILAKREGLKALRRWRQALAEMRMPEEGLASGVLILVGGILLLTPGVITDATGLACLFPPTRRILAGVLRQQFIAKLAQAGHLHYATTPSEAPFGPGATPPDQVIDVEAHPVGEPGPRNKTPPAA